MADVPIVGTSVVLSIAPAKVNPSICAPLPTKSPVKVALLMAGSLRVGLFNSAASAWIVPFKSTPLRIPPSIVPLLVMVAFKVAFVIVGLSKLAVCASILPFSSVISPPPPPPPMEWIVPSASAVMVVPSTLTNPTWFVFAIGQ